MLFAAAAAMTSAVEGAQAPPDQKRVLVIYSTRRDSLISEAAERILTQQLDEVFGIKLDYYAEYIDPARFPVYLPADGSVRPNVAIFCPCACGTR